MKCNNCGNEFAVSLRGGYFTNEKGERQKWESCDRCSKFSVAAMPDCSDVHEPYFDEHLADKQHPQGQWIYSRGHKASVLKQLGLREKRESTVKYIEDVKSRQKYFRDTFGE